MWWWWSGKYCVASSRGSFPPLLITCQTPTLSPPHPPPHLSRENGGVQNPLWQRKEKLHITIAVQKGGVIKHFLRFSKNRFRARAAALQSFHKKTGTLKRRLLVDNLQVSEIILNIQQYAAEGTN